MVGRENGQLAMGPRRAGRSERRFVMAGPVCSKLEEQAAYLREGGFIGWSPLRRHTEWHAGGIGEFGQEVPLPGSGDPFGTVGRDDPRAPRDGQR